MLQKSKSHSILNVSKIFIDKRSNSSPVANQVLAKFPEAEVVNVDSHWKIPELNENKDLLKKWNQIKRTHLILGYKSGMSSKENGRSTDYIAPSHSNGCTMACTYCYVARRKGYANPVTVFTNIDEILDSITSHSSKLGMKLPNQCDQRFWTYDIGCNNDCSTDALVSDNVERLVSLFRTLPNAKASFATKYVNRDLLNYNPEKKTRIRFSLMPDKVAKVVDVRTSSISSRIQALEDFYQAGYEVHLNFSPVILYKGWDDDYKELMHQIDQSISPGLKKQLKCEVIFLTHNKKLHELNKTWHPKGESYLWTPELQEDKVSLYGGHNLRYKRHLKAHYIKVFKNILSQTMPYMDIRYIF
jgi:spore photoproduct lyase